MHPLENTQIAELPKALCEEMLEELAVFAMQAEDGEEDATPDSEAVALAARIRERVMYPE